MEIQAVDTMDEHSIQTDPEPVKKATPVKKKPDLMIEADAEEAPIQPKPKVVPQTAKATERKITFNEDMDFEERKTGETVMTPSSRSSMKFSDFLNAEYQRKRDPMKEFFQLTAQCVKLRSPNMQAILTVDVSKMYDLVLKEGKPYWEWRDWIEQKLHKEVLSKLFSDHKRVRQSFIGNLPRPQDLDDKGQVRRGIRTTAFQSGSNRDSATKQETPTGKKGGGFFSKFRR